VLDPGTDGLLHLDRDIKLSALLQKLADFAACQTRKPYRSLAAFSYHS